MPEKLAVAIGIDPGKKGAIGYLTSGGYGDVIDMPEDIHECLKGIIQGADISRVFCCVEKQGSWGLHDKLQGKRLSEYLVHYGTILASLKILQIKYQEVPARTWQSSLLGPIPKNMTKIASAEYAGLVAPWLKSRVKAVTTGRADAICLAIYARETAKMMHEGDR